MTVFGKGKSICKTLKSPATLRSREGQKRTVWMEQGGRVVPLSWSTSRPRPLLLLPFHILAHIPLRTDKLQLELLLIYAMVILSNHKGSIKEINCM